MAEFVENVLIDGCLTIKKTVSGPKKGFDFESLLMLDYAEADFEFLYGKSDAELNLILEKYSIEIPAQGVGRNSKLEKISFIKRYCDEEGVGKTKRYVKDDYKLCASLPGVELFKADYGLEADTKFKTNSVSEVLGYLEVESNNNKKLARVEEELIGEMRREAQLVKSYMGEYVAGIQEVEITPSISWKDAIKSVDVSFKFEGDSCLLPMSHKGAGYRRLFMVARFRYLAEKKKKVNIIYLIEEPETFLHPSAQTDLLHALLDLSEDSQVVIATHSPVFAGATHIDSVILCQKENGSIYEDFSVEGREKFLGKIVSELGIKPSYNLRDTHEKIVFVESHNDARFYDLVCKEMIGSSLLDAEEILVLPFGGGEDIDSFLNIDYFDKFGLSLYLIIDSDKAQGKLKKQEERTQSFQQRKKDGYSYVLNKSCLENYYHPRAIERKY